MSTASRRSLLGALGGVSAAALLAACGSDGSGSGSPGSGGTTTATGAFPVTVAHKYGSTTVRSAPKRVVCVGLVEQDTLLALGVVPVAITPWLPTGDEGYPWEQPKLHGGSLKQLPSTLNIEKIAATRPDLIIAIYSGISAGDYARLSKIAPTIAQAKVYADYAVPWDVASRTVADAIGRHTAGGQLVTKVKGTLAAAKKSHPQFAGRTAVVGTVNGDGGLNLYTQDDPRIQIQRALGFRYPTGLRPKSDESFFTTLSPERAREVDFDVVVWLASQNQVRKATGGLFEQTKAAQQGRVIYIPQTDRSDATPPYAAGFSFVTPLSIPWTLHRYVPQLVAAVDGKTTTEVPAPTT
ncbi:ABC transporter substrate-binding protein [Flexivirga oryzae]|uniref:Iron complex transport system substrate-binding protein n=1 Tax=Flexivirga oryzae TaxID=1794944 RepID=A0A839N4G7_9MICO|nr:ABC transporter substrate-binding protein [Flexivirga oryzae]MBB2890536.1 iron complex transport system substrate-binding protein [Flexivirga oryzae]